MDAGSDRRATAFCKTLDELTAVVERHRDGFDRDRRLPDPVIDAVADAGLLRLWLPEALGGPQLSPLDFMDVVEAAAALDGSLGWIIGNGAGMSRVAGYLAERTARELFAPPRAFVASSTGATGAAVRTQGGYRVSGRWPFASGVHHATHLMALCGVQDHADAPATAVIACYFPAADATIIDTWHVSGLKGTGSCDFEVHDLFVPTDHAHAFPEHQPTQPGLLFRLPNVSMFAWSVSVVPLGIARGALSRFRAVADGKLRAGLALADQEPVQAALGRAETRYRAARALLKQAMTDLMAAAEAQPERLVEARIRLRAACAFAAESAVEVVDRVAGAAGTAAIFESHGLERSTRDVHAAAKHVAMSPTTYTVAGRHSLGRELGTARF